MGGETIKALIFVNDINFCTKTEENLQNMLFNVNKIL